MKKILLLYVVLIVAVVLLATTRNGGNFASFMPFKSVPTATINEKKINLIVAKTDEEKIKGLSGRESLGENEGMLFVFDEKDEYSFWMKDMKFPIDIIYIDDDTVVGITKNAPVPKESEGLVIYKPESPVNYILEINANRSDELEIKKGTKVEFHNL